jgi:hypothetical protein
MDKIGYILFIKLYPLIANILSPFNSKAALWVKGRRNILNKINTALKKDNSKKYGCIALRWVSLNRADHYLKN